MNGLPVKKIAARDNRSRRSSVGALVGSFCFSPFSTPFLAPPNTLNSISIGGYPPWSPETNHQYPVECKQVVKTLLMIHSIHPQSKQPRHPECLLFRLPMELLLEIIRLAVDQGERYQITFPNKTSSCAESYFFDSEDGELKRLPQGKYIMDAAWGTLGRVLALTCK